MMHLELFFFKDYKHIDCFGLNFLLQFNTGAYKYQIVCTEQIQSLYSNQEETDSRVVLYCKYAQDNGYEYVRVRSPDSDVFFVLLHHVTPLSCNIIFDTRTGNNKRLINMTNFVENLTQEYCTTLTALHAFTHCDSTSAFKGIGKVKPIKVMQRILDSRGQLLNLENNGMSLKR